MRDPISRAELDVLRMSSVRHALTREEAERIFADLERLVAVRERAEHLRQSAIKADTVELSGILFAAYKIVEGVVQVEEGPATRPAATRVVQRPCRKCQGIGEMLVGETMYPCGHCGGQGWDVL